MRVEMSVHVPPVQVFTFTGICTKAVSRLNARMEKERGLVSRYNVLCRDMTP